MLRKTLVALTAAAALGVSSAAIAAGHGGHGEHGSPGHSVSMPGNIGSGPGRGPGTMSNVNAPQNFNTPRNMGPTGKNWTGNTWAGGPRHHHRFHNRAFFGVGFAGPFYDYGYDSCWRLVPTYWGGWRRVWVCDYPYPYGGY